MRLTVAILVGDKNNIRGAKISSKARTAELCDLFCFFKQIKKIIALRMDQKSIIFN